ncbi:hypothetical protein Vadar_017177 [Vaccinium darrowii]|uniref:Uncharacterized protein n=2 Tax=Vaccinium darrowii TaxID=229202 RepID=A0ACB7XP99_9ERIC|nr:hypothetical protein Vadar_008608 [Vaccinium darrowii]KAH7843487.1 hypothetical protein Vadar_017177 [Vaccinium darrowii]
MGRVRTKIVKKSSRQVIERYYSKMTLRFPHQPEDLGRSGHHPVQAPPQQDRCGLESKNGKDLSEDDDTLTESGSEESEFSENQEIAATSDDDDSTDGAGHGQQDHGRTDNGERSSLPASGPEAQRHASAIRRKITILGTRLDSLQSLLSKLPSKQPL